MWIDLPQGRADTTARVVTGPAGSHPLREKEARLLELLAEQPGGTVRREDLLTRVFGYPPTSRSRTLDSTMKRLRQALAAAGVPDPILTVYGEGYRLLAGPSARAPRPEVVGRRAERERLRALLADPGARLVSIVGLGGAGKSTLVADVTDDRPDLVCLDLAGVAPGAEELRRLVQQAVGAAHEEDPASIFARRGPTVLVLDNAETSIAAAREAVPRWLGARSLRVWLTSRVPLEVPGEQVVLVGPMAAGDAQDLLRLRAGRALDQDEEAELPALLDALDGHPLSISFAGARLHVLSVSELRRRIDALLVGGPGVAERQRSLDGVLRSTVSLLEAPGRAALQQACLLPRAWTVERYLDVVQVEGHLAEDLLQQMVSHSLVRRDPDGRFRVQSGVRAVIPPLAPEDRRAAERRWVAALIRSAEEAHREGRAGPDSAELEAALGVAPDADAGAHLLVALVRGWGKRDDPRRLRAYASQLAPSSALGRARVETAAAFAALVDDPGQALIHADRALSLAHESGDELAVCDALTQRAAASSYHPDPARCAEDLRELAERHRAMGRQGGEIDAALTRASALGRAGRHQQAREVLATLTGRVPGALPRDPAGRGRALRYWQLEVDVAIELGDRTGVARALDAVAEIAERGVGEERAWARLELSYGAVLADDLDLAVRHGERALEDAREAWLVTQIRTNLAVAHVHALRWGEARTELETLLGVGMGGGRRSTELAHHTAEWITRVRGELDAARHHRREAARARSGVRLQAFEDAMVLAQAGDLVEALDVQRAVVAGHSGADWGGQRVRSADLLLDLLLASGAWEEAAEVAARLLRDPCLPALAHAKVAAGWRAASARPDRSPSFEGKLLHVAAMTWEVVARARAGRRPEALELAEQVRAKMDEGRLPPTSEIAWRWRRALEVSGVG